MLEGQSVVKNDTKIANGWRKDNVNAVDLHRLKHVKGGCE